MKKKNLIVLLLIPFLIALLGVVTINTTFNMIDNDILSIKWDYDDMEGFKLSDTLYELKATGVNQKNYPTSMGNALVWSIRNKNANDENKYAEIIEKNNTYYLQTYACGEVVITCSNEKGNVFRSMNAVIYENAAILISASIQGSQNNIDPMIYYGEYDLQNGKKVPTTIDLKIKVVPSTMEQTLILKDISENIQSIDLESQKLVLKENAVDTNELAYFTLDFVKDGITEPTTYQFEIVDEGINCYTYDDLLYCTNQSEAGEIVVLRKSFESLDNMKALTANNVECFGHYDSNEKFSFRLDKQEIYAFTTTYNHEFIRQWNENIQKQGGSNFISDQILVGLHVQKDFYGNGYTINMHHLTYPTLTQEVSDGNGGVVQIPYLSEHDLFRGPLPFYALGDHNNMPLVEAFGQDNIGMYVDGDDIVINDVTLKNCDFGNMLSNLNTVGTVLETNGNDITIQNSKLSNGKNVVRSFSSMRVTLQNSILSNARNFLLSIGTNEYLSTVSIEEEISSFLAVDGSEVSSSLKDYLKKDAFGDVILNDYLMGSFETKNSMKFALLSIQDVLNPSRLVEGLYRGSMTIVDSFFYRSGVASISLDTLFNGPFLYANVPSSISEILGMLQTQDGIALSELVTSNISGMSYPVELTISGNTKFYDYKETTSMDISGLICENISSFAASIQPDYAGIIDIDKIFPIKSQLFAKAPLYASNNAQYINVPVAFYGGGANLSTVQFDQYLGEKYFASPITIDLLDAYLTLASSDDMITTLKNMMLKAVTVVTGYEPFQFICLDNSGYLFGETPNLSILIENAKGGSL